MMEYRIIYYGFSLLIGIGIFYQLVNNRGLQKIKKIILGVWLCLLLLALYPVGILLNNINIKGELVGWSINNVNLLNTVSYLQQNNRSQSEQLFRLQSLDLNTGKIVSRSSTTDLNRVNDFKNEKNFIAEQSFSKPFWTNDVTLQNHQRLRMLGSNKNQIQTNDNNIFVNLAVDSSLTFFKGAFLTEGFSINAIELTIPKSVMVVSKNASDDLVFSLISRVSLEDGKLIWQKHILNSVGEDGYIKWTTLINETLIVLTNQQVMALNIQDGEVEWVVDF